MTAGPLVSIIVPAFNHERYVEHALGSLVAQTHPLLELIVLDDGSTDETFARIQRLAPDLVRRFARVEIDTQSHEGSSATISRCLTRAQSDLVYMLDSDDIAYPEAIECLLRMMASPKVALAVGDNEYIDADGVWSVRERDGEQFSTLVSFFTSRLEDFSVERDFGSYRSLIQGNYIPNGWLLRRSLIDDAGGFPAGFVLDDWPLLLQLAKTYKIEFAGRVLAKYRLHDRNTFRVHNKRLVLETAQILLQERRYCRDHGLESEWWRHAHRVFETLSPDEIAELASASRNTASHGHSAASIEDLVRLASRESDVLRAHWDLDSALEHGRQAEELLQTERRRLQSTLDDTTERLRLTTARIDETEAERSNLLSRLNDTIARLHLEEVGRRQEREAFRARISAVEHQLSEMEGSRSWRWAAPLRAIEKAFRGSSAQRWHIHLDGVTSDSNRFGALELSGWAFHADSPVTRVEISLNRGAPVIAEYGLERPDVTSAFPHDRVGCPGFRALVYALEDPVTLRIAMVCEDGRRELVEQALRRPPAMNQRAREIYGAPDQTTPQWVGRIRASLRYGPIGRYLWESTRIRGWIRGKGEAEALASASYGLAGSPVIVEVGSFLGCSTVLLAGPRKARGTGRVHCVDSFAAAANDAADPVYRAIADSLGMPIRAAFDRNMRRAGVAEWITVHEMLSHDAAAEWNTPIDLLFLDGDVSREGAREIFADWSPFLQSGGVLAINGTNEPGLPLESDKVVDEFVRPPHYADIRRIDHITFARKAAATSR